MNRTLAKELNNAFIDLLQSVSIDKISSYIFPEYPSDTSAYIMNCWINDMFPEKYSIEMYRPALYNSGVSYNPDKAIELVNEQILNATNNYIKNSSLIKIGGNTSLASTMAQFGSDEWIESWNAYASNNITAKDASQLWKTIDNVIDDIGKEVYDKIANYVDNISNIDLCNIKALNSICKYTKYNNTALLSYNYPTEIEDLINIFSINKNLLINSSKVLSEPTRYNILQIISSKEGNSINSTDPRVTDHSGAPIFTFKLTAGSLGNNNKD